MTKQSLSNTQRAKTQAGNAVIYILLGVMLFGALAYTFMRGAKTGQGNLTAQQSKLAAQEILNFSQDVSKTIDKLRNRGCSENQISFERPSNSLYTNSGTPSDGSCKVFDSAGGGLAWPTISSAWLDQTKSAQFAYGDFFFSGIQYIYNSSNPSSNTPELNIILPYIDKKICLEINRILGLNSAGGYDPQVNNGHAWVTNPTTTYFKGTFPITRVINPTDNSEAGCFAGLSGTVPDQDTYHFYKVLIVR